MLPPVKQQQPEYAVDYAMWEDGDLTGLLDIIGQDYSYKGRKKIAKDNLSPKDEIKSSLGKHHKPGHLPEDSINELDLGKVARHVADTVAPGISGEIGRAHV